MAELSEIAAWLGESTKLHTALNREITRVSAMEDAAGDAAVFAVDEESLKAALVREPG